MSPLPQHVMLIPCCYYEPSEVYEIARRTGASGLITEALCQHGTPHSMPCADCDAEEFPDLTDYMSIATIDYMFANRIAVDAHGIPIIARDGDNVVYVPACQQYLITP